MEDSWPRYPFDPNCRERVPIDQPTIEAVRRVIADWDGRNWAAVAAAVEAAAPLRELRELTVFDIRMIFAVRQGELVVKLGGVPRTTDATVQTFDFAGCPGPTPAAADPRGDVRRIPDRARRAWAEYQQAVEVLGGEPSDREAYEQVTKANAAAGEPDELPSFDTWSRNLREARRRLGASKHAARAKRVDVARSIVHRDEL